MKFGVILKRITLLLLFTFAAILSVTSCSTKKKSYSDVERDFVDKHQRFFWDENYINKELALYKHDDYYFYHYSFVKKDENEEFERVSVWEFSKTMNGIDFYKENANIYLKPYNLSENYAKEYSFYLKAIDSGLVKEYTAKDIEKLEDRVKSW